jgi:uncharacterized protein YbjT (DUF2867 family)
MPKYVLTGVGGNLGTIAANYALQILPEDTTLVLTTTNPDKIPQEALETWKEKGAIIHAASYDDVSSLERVFTGAEAVTLISTWSFGRRAQQAQNVIAAAKSSGVRRICYTSFVGADNPAPREEMPFLPRDHKETEELIRQSGLEWNIQRDYLYMDNIPKFFASSWKFCGERWLCNSHGAPGAYVASEDCGRVLAALLLGRGEVNTVYDITGPEAVTDMEIFEWMCAQSGYRGEFIDLPDEEFKEWWLGRGLPDDVSGDFSRVPMKLCIDDLLCCGEMVAKGYMAKTSNAVEELTGRKPLSFREGLLQYKGLFP